MKVLSLWQPYASLIILGAKKIETRSWATRYRGPVLIHASAKYGKDELEFAREIYFDRVLRTHYLQWGPSFRPPFKPSDLALPTGCIIGQAELTDCREMKGVLPGELAPWVNALSDEEQAFGRFEPDRFGFSLESPRRLKVPIPAKGQLGIWDYDGEFELAT